MGWLHGRSGNAILSSIVIAGIQAFLLLMLPMDGLPVSQTLDALDRLRWERRVLLLFAEPGQAEAERAQLERSEAALQDRDMDWFLIEAGEITASNHAAPLEPDLGRKLLARYEPKPEPLEVLLIGKDGGLKARGPTLNLEDLLGQVDRMPMRRRELHERGE